MTGWRLGFAVGNAELVAGLGLVKSQIDSGAFDAVQLAGIEAWKAIRAAVTQMRQMYTERRDVLVGGLQKLAWRWKSPRPPSTCGAPPPKGVKSADFTMRLLSECGIVTTPGNGFARRGRATCASPSPWTRLAWPRPSSAWPNWSSKPGG